MSKSWIVYEKDDPRAARIWTRSTSCTQPLRFQLLGGRDGQYHQSPEVVRNQNSIATVPPTRVRGMSKTVRRGRRDSAARRHFVRGRHPSTQLAKAHAPARSSRTLRGPGSRKPGSPEPIGLRRDAHGRGACRSVGRLRARLPEVVYRHGSRPVTTMRRSVSIRTRAPTRTRGRAPRMRSALERPDLLARCGARRAAPPRRLRRMRYPDEITRARGRHEP